MLNGVKSLVSRILNPEKRAQGEPSPNVLTEPSNHELTGLILEAWKQTVQVQMHFNDLCLRIRTLALTGLTFAFGAAITTLRYAQPVHFKILIFHGTHSPAVVVAFIGLIVCWNFYQLDANWYHMLLRGSVVEGANLEISLRNQGLPINLGGSISSHSRRKKRFRIGGKDLLEAKAKLQRFYGLWFIGLFILFLITWFDGQAFLK